MGQDDCMWGTSNVAGYHWVAALAETASRAVGWLL